MTVGVSFYVQSEINTLGVAVREKQEQEIRRRCQSNKFTHVQLYALKLSDDETLSDGITEGRYWTQLGGIFFFLFCAILFKFHKSLWKCQRLQHKFTF